MNTGVIWLRDLLPSVYPRARIWSYGYGTRASVIEVVENLLREAQDIQKDAVRPIMWIAHSFGGLVIKSVCTFTFLVWEWTRNDSDSIRPLQKVN
jgi:hypothetical protein